MSIILRVTNDKGQVADLQPIEDIDLRLDISAIENGDIGTTFGISSQDFAIAGTNEANQFFGNLYNLGATPAVALQNSIECQVLNNSQETFTGKLYIRNIITDQQGYTIYNVVVVNETIDFKYRIQNLSLNDPKFDWSDYDHAFTAGNVTGSWYGNLFSGSVVYPHVNYGTPENDPTCPNYSFGGYYNGVQLENTIDNYDTPLRLTDFKPAIKVKNVLDIIFSGSYTSGSIGYSYTSSFLNSEYFNNLYFLATADDQIGPANNNPVIQSAWVYRSGSTQTILGGTTNNIDFNDKSYDNSNNFNLTTDRYTADISGSYNLTGQITFTISSWVSRPNSWVEVNVYKAPPPYIANATLVGQFRKYNPFATTGSLLFTATADLDAGDILFAQATYADPGGSLVQNLVLHPGTTKTFLQVNGPASVLGGTVQMNQQFSPDLKALDFIQGLIEKFNLVVEPVPNKKNLLLIEPYDAWADAGVVTDWTNKVDRSIDFEISHPILEQPRTILFSDEDDDDYLNEYTKATTDRTYGQYVYTSDSDLAEGERRIGKVFAPTPTTNIPNSTQFIIPHLCTKTVGSSDAYRPIVFKPRLLYGIGLQDVESNANGYSGSIPVTSSYFLRDEIGNVTRQTQWYQVSSLSEMPISGAAFDLHFNNNNQAFGATAPYWSNVVPQGANFISGSGDAFTTYWANYINGLYDIDARKLVCNVYLKPSELSTLRLNQKIFIDGTYYRINKINGANLSRRDSVEVELIKSPARKLTFPRRRVRNTTTGASRDVQFQGYNPNGGGRYADYNTGATVDEYNIISQAGPLDGLRVYPSGSGGATASVVWNYEPAIIPALQQTVIGTNQVNPDASKIAVLGSQNTVASTVSTAQVMGQYNNILQNVTNAFIVGQLNTIGETAVNTQILGGVGNYTTGSNNNLSIVGSTGSYASNTDYSSIINGYNAGLRDSDVTTLINPHENEVVINGNGHTVIGLNFEGGGLDLLNTRENSVWLGDTYIGEALFRAQKVLLLGSGTTIDLSDNVYRHDNLFVLDWTGLSPASASIVLPNALNNDYKNIIYTFATSGSFVGGNGGLTEAVISGFSGQKINGQSSYIIKNPYQAVTLTTTGNGWITLSDNVTNTYGAFYATSSQPLDAPATAQVIELNDGWEDYGIYISGSSKLIIEKPGTYQLSAVIQLSNDSNQPEDAVFWLKFNGTNWPFSSTRTTIPAEKSSGNPSSQVIPMSFVGTSVAPGDYVELYWAGTSTDLTLKYYPDDALGAVEPDAPSVSVMITPIS